MTLVTNSDINSIKFLSNNTSFLISEKFIKDLKEKSSQIIDEECYNLMLKDIREKKTTFQITPQEQNYLKKIPDNKALEYLIYRYKFKVYPKKKISTNFPIYILIEPVSSCNLKCPMCFQSDKSFINKDFMGKMNLDLFKKIIDEAKENGTNAITFGSRGEPTIHPNICEMIDYVGHKFLDIKLITNATRLTNELIHTIFKNNIHQVVFSIDSEEKETYERLRKFSNFEKMLENVKRFNEIKSNYDNIHTITRISGVKVEKTQNEKSFYNFWKNFSDEVVFKQAFSRWDTYNNEAIPELTEPCNYIWERMYIWFDGKVNPCDADYKSYLSYGDVKKNTIKEIWNSKKYKELKNIHLNNKRNELNPCDRCGIS